MKQIFIIAAVSFFPKFISSQIFQDFTYQNCPSVETTTSSKLVTAIKLSVNLENWPDLSFFLFKRKSEVIFIYSPFNNIIQMENNRFRISREASEMNFDIHMSFTPDEDSAVDFQFGYQANRLMPYSIFCEALINDDSTPQAILFRKPILDNEIFSKNEYAENEKIFIICQVLKIDNNMTFEVKFPAGTNEVLVDSKVNMKKYSLTLKSEIRNGNISCLVESGYSSWSTELLVFSETPKLVVEGNRKNIAISLSIIFVVLLFVMIIIGVYSLIIKQRRGNTKRIVEHHAENVRRSTVQLRDEMNQYSDLKVRNSLRFVEENL